MPIATEIRPYRPDIDGLRSVAILAVLLAHAGFSAFAGGDTALTVFFVIAGYFMAEALIRSGGRLSIGAFYDRRARRMIPTLVVATMATLVAGALFLSSAEVTDLWRAGLASVGLVSNLVRVDGAGADALQHTWTLSLVGQMFLMLPLVIVVCGRAKLRAAMPLVLVGTLVSFSLAASDAPWAGAVQVQHRAWEFGFGALVALAPPLSLRKAVVEALALLGLAAILLPVFLYPTEAPRSGVGALPTAMGAALVIWANRNATLVRTALGSSPFIFLGVISYSLYVWHWPILVFARRAFGELDTSSALLCLAATLIVATASWYFVEQPMRYPNGTVRSRASVLAASLAGLVSVAALAAMVVTDASLATSSGIYPAYADDAAPRPMLSERATGTNATLLLQANGRGFTIP